MSSTQNFGLERFGPNGRISDNSYKFSGRDRDTIDALLWTFANHDHRDTSVESVMSGPNGRPELEEIQTGGSIPAGQTLYYEVSYVDSFGNETEASVAGVVSTESPLPTPPVMTVVNSTTGGALDPGVYRYAFSYYQSGIGETKATNITSINIPVGTSTNEVTLTLDTLPASATGWKVYRKGPGDIDYFLLDTTSSSPYVDDGLDLALDCTKVRPTSNSTNSTNKVTLVLPAEDLPLDSRVASWRIYRSNTVGFFGPTSLLATVVETVTQAGSDLVTSYVDVGAITVSGSPLISTVVPPPAPQLDVSDVFAGDTRLPAKHAPQGIHAHATSLNGTLAVQDYNQFYVVEDMPLERMDLFYQLAPTGVDGSNYVTVRISDDAAGNAVQSVYTTAEVLNEKQSVYNNATDGTFTLSDGSDTTSAIDFDALSTVIETRLEADITAITDVFVTGTGTPLTPWIIEWLDPGGTDVSYTLTADDGNLTGGTSTVAVNQEGSDGGTFTLTFDGQTTSALDFDETGIKSQGTLTMDTQPTDTNTMTVDGKVYTFQDSLTDTDGNVNIGGSLAQAKLNIVAAFDLSGTAGVDYADSMTAHASVDMGTFATDDSVLTAQAFGKLGNSIVTDETFTAGTNIFDAGFLGTTTAGVDPLEPELETLSTITSVNVTGSGTEGDPWLVEFVDPGGQDVVIMTTDDSSLNGTAFIAMVTEGFGATQEEVVVNAVQAYHFWQSSTTDFDEIEGEDATGDGITVSDALATNDVAVYLDTQNDIQEWVIGTVIDEGAYVARFFISVESGVTAELRVVDQDGGDTTIASTTISDGSSFLPAKTLNFPDTGGAEDWKFEVEKTDAGSGEVRIDKFEYQLRNPILHKGSTATIEVLVTNSPSTNGDDAQLTVWY